MCKLFLTFRNILICFWHLGVRVLRSDERDEIQVRRECERVTAPPVGPRREPAPRPASAKSGMLTDLHFHRLGQVRRDDKPGCLLLMEPERMDDKPWRASAIPSAAERCDRARHAGGSLRQPRLHTSGTFNLKVCQIL